VPLLFWSLVDVASAASFVPHTTTLAERGLSLVGIGAFIGLCWLISERRDRIQWRPVVWGVALQIAICSIVLIPGLSQSLVWMSSAVAKLLSFAGEGATFVFQSVQAHTIQVGPPPGETQFFVGTLNGISPPVKTFAFWVLPTIIFFSAFSNVLYHFGVLQWVVKGIGWVMQRTLGTSGAETLCTAGNIFLGQTEAPLLIRPFIADMTRSELMAVMVGGFATIAVGVLGLYAEALSAIPNIGGHLVIASIISAPATFVCAKLVVPETEVSRTAGSTSIELPKGEGNLLQAIAIGATDGVKLAINVAAMLIAIVALVAMVDFAIAGVGLSLSQILGWIFFPFAVLMGVPFSEAATVGALLGKKLVLTELVAYFDMSAMLKADQATPVLSQRGAIIAAYALCGFANFASVGIQIGGIGALAEKRIGDLSSLGMKAMAVGSIATCMTGAVVGLFV
jgi:CNT family concentrative nucleoside transporter